MKKILKQIKYRFIPYFQAIPTFLKQNECQKYMDCVLYHQLIAKSPRYYDRAIEYPWALKHVDITQGNFLDVGSTVGTMFRDHLADNVEVYIINQETEQRFKDVKGVNAITGDIRNTQFETNKFDVITCISTIEHIGVEGRYHVKADPLGDKNAMNEMLRILKPGGKLLLTVPYGAKDMLPINKLYNKSRIKDITKGYNIISSEYQKYDERFHIWSEVKEEEAAKVDWLKERWYALALFVLEKPKKK